MGRRMDDAGAAVALPSLGDVGHRQYSGNNATRRALVPALALRPLARRQRASTLNSHWQKTRNQMFRTRVVVIALLGEETTMRWKISHRGHDPRQIDLFAIIVILIAIAAAYLYFTHRADRANSAAFIVPSQSVRW